MKKVNYVFSLSVIAVLCQNCSPGFKSKMAGQITNGSSAVIVPTEAVYTCVDPKKRGSANLGVRRMTKTEFINTLLPLIGTTTFKDSLIQGQLSLLPSDSLDGPIQDYRTLPREEIASVLLKIADRAVEITDATPASRAARFGNCVNTTPVTTACSNLFITTFGARVFRRPLTTSEIERYTKIMTDRGGGVPGLLSTFFTLLQAPTLSLHIEIGSQDIENRRRLTDYEIANRISYAVTEAPPDNTLKAAAEKGELQNLANVRIHVQRLLVQTSSPASERVKSFFRFYARLGDIADPHPVVAKAHGITSTGGLGSMMVRELDDYVQGIFWKPTGDFKDFMLSRDSYPRHQSLQTILGTSAIVAADGKAVQASPSHIGFLHRPVFLASDGFRTNPILRGAHLRQRFLCDRIPDPPTELVEQAVQELGDIEDQSNRAKYQQLTGSSKCIGCHSMINPVGFAFESYDPLGMPRQSEPIYSDTGSVVTTYPINTTVSKPGLEPAEPPNTQIADSIALSQIIANGSKGRQCYVQRTFEFINRREVEAESDHCAMAELETTSRTGTLRDVFINSIANEDIFWRKIGDPL